MGYELVEIKAEGDLRDCHSLRRQVLWEARGLSGYDEKDKDDYASTNHLLLLKLDGRTIGTARLDDFQNGTGGVRLVAIALDLQRHGHGRILSELVENYARHLGLKILFINAAPEAIGYYEKMGWEYYTWDESELCGIASECKQMRKILNND